MRAEEILAIIVVVGVKITIVTFLIFKMRKTLRQLKIVTEKLETIESVKDEEIEELNLALAAEIASRKEKNDMVLWLIGNSLSLKFYNSMPSLTFVRYEMDSEGVNYFLTLDSACFGRRLANEPQLQAFLDTLGMKLHLKHRFKIQWLNPSQPIA